MRFFLIMACFVTFLWAEYPKVYRAIGDQIYMNIESIEKLKDVRDFYEYKAEIDVYVVSVEHAKEYGFLVEKNDPSVDKNIYLEDIRRLSTTNNFFVRLVTSKYKEAIQNTNSELFVEMINSSLLNIEEYEEEILNYYDKHADGISRSGVIDTLLTKREEAIQKQNEELKRRQSVVSTGKKDTEQEKVERLRKADQEKKEALKKALEEEEQRKKSEIIQKQKEALSR